MKLSKFSVHCLVALLLLCATLLSGCQSGNQTDTQENTENRRQQDAFDVWDGTVAASFGGGDGSESDPYQIKSAAQFAFLAKEINSIKNQSYKGKVFSLLCNIDLNHIEWTPIGNIMDPFDGIFYGNQHVIKNLTIISDASSTIQPLVTDLDLEFYALGLFGSCQNVVIQDLDIDNATFAVTSVPSNCHQVTCVGVLIGRLLSLSDSKVYNVRVSDAEITAAPDPQDERAMDIGGIIGTVITDGQNSSFDAQRMQADVHVLYTADFGFNNSIGGLFGTVKPDQSCNIRDGASYLTVDMTDGQAREDENWSNFGAIGYMSLQNVDARLSNLFSKVVLNRDHDPNGEDSQVYFINAIIGKMYGSSAPSDTIGQYYLENLFGYVEQPDGYSEGKQTTYNLCHILQGSISSEKNCLGCSSLPENHGFDPEIWELSDTAHPTIK